ncbi:sigma-70 family RNA polymerase sigma factor [Bacillus sp. T33-2]|uniref:sigma-70 family RNA polymerase sigma factor n=1 Tax=Bacillus sp. T33-2 TaxID=2054168 RepID=UPI000C77D4BF|nr:sigma-70 family RNA polymerase sigma factor [Bacillus sp. T33-2]PLR89853.1 RNA polymerase subunit sigma [Bacillus sp. T33-2]
MHAKKLKENSSLNDNNLSTKEELLVCLMEEYGDMVIRLAYTYIKQKQLAEDISQEVFISCYQNLDKFQKKAAYKTWLYRITVNKCKDHIKSWSFKNISYKDYFGSLLAGGTPPTESPLIDREEKEIIFEKVLNLPLKLREVIILYYYEELPISEITELLNINSNTVKTRLHRARNSLKNLFEGENIHGK